MNSNLPTDWDPTSETVQADQIAAYDEILRIHAPLIANAARESDWQGWSCV